MLNYEAVLTYYPNGVENGDVKIIIGKTSDPNMVRILWDLFESKVQEEISFWEEIDSDVASMYRTDVQGIIKLLKP